MSSLNGRKVSCVRFHAPYHIVGVGQLGPGAVTCDFKGKSSLTLEYHDGGVLISGKNDKSKPFAAYVPGGNIIGLDLVADATNS